MDSARKAALHAAVGGGAVLTGYQGMLLTQALIARRAIGVTDERPPNPNDVYGADLPGAPLRVLVLGDSAAVGYGMTRADATPPAAIGLALAQLLDRPVDVRSEAVVGAQTSDLRDQIDSGLEHRPQLAAIVIGANDVTHRVPSYVSSRLIAAAVRRLVAADVKVVVGTCPDLGTIEPIPQPLRYIAMRKSRTLARKQMVAVVRAGGRAVSLGDLLRPLFTERSDIMFGDDRFHPSEAGYANLVGVLVPSLAAAWRERNVDHTGLGASVLGGTASVPDSGSWATDPGSVPLSEAAQRAALSPGAEVTQQGRWARVLRRIRN